MHEKNGELVESLHQFIATWILIGKPFPQVDGTDRPGLTISWMRSPVSIHCSAQNSARMATIMNPTRVDWVKGAASVTPTGYWYEHVNESGSIRYPCYTHLGRRPRLRICPHSISRFTARAHNKPKATAVVLPFHRPAPVRRFR